MEWSFQTWSALLLTVIAMMSILKILLHQLLFFIYKLCYPSSINYKLITFDLLLDNILPELTTIIRRNDASQFLINILCSIIELFVYFYIEITRLP